MISLLSVVAFAGEPVAPVAPAAVPADSTVAVVAEPVAAPAEGVRSKPEVTPPTAFELSAPEIKQLGGVTVWYVPAKGYRKTQVQLILDRGVIDLDGKSTPAGDATGALWDYASLTQDADAVSELEDLYDLDVSSWISGQHAGLDLEVPNDELTRGLDLMRGLLRTPAFPKVEVKRYIRETRLYYTAEAPMSTRSVASSVLQFSWFPADHPYGTRPDLTALGALKPTALLDRHQRLLSTAPMKLVVVSDQPWETLATALTPLVEGLGQPGAATPEPAFTPPTASRWIGVDMPGPQATVRMRTAAPLRADPDRVAAHVLNFVVGGSFLSRLNSNLREEKGWTYGARSTLAVDDTVGTWTFGLDVKVEHVGETMTEIGKELDRVVAEGVRADEIVGARNSMVSGWNSTLETGVGAANFYSGLHIDDVSLAAERADVLALDGIRPEDTQRVAAKWLAPANPRVWVLVGDRAQIEPQLQKMGVTAEWLTPDQAVLGTF